MLVLLIEFMSTAKPDQRPHLTHFKRFAVYYAPEPSPLAEFGAHWLGWDLATGTRVEHPDIQGLDIASLTEAPRKYGLHGTIKPPFRLAQGYTPDDLDTAIDMLCTTQSAITLTGLQLSRLGSFLALTPTGDTGPLNALAATIVAQLDCFRAPLTETELTRRRKSRLSPNQEKLLQQWGYPYVMQEFRFHITLTGKMPRTEAEHLRNALAPRLEPLLPAPFHIKTLCLVGEDHQNNFHLIKRYSLSRQAKN